MSEKDPLKEKQKAPPKEFLEEVETREIRKIRARREGDQGTWFGLGMFGLIGWAVAIPTLIGVVVGIWIDRKWSSSYSWTLMCMIFGVLIGCLNAWYWVKNETRKR